MHIDTHHCIATGDGKLTKAAIQDLIDASASTSSDDHLIQIIDARAVPRLCYDPIRKAFYHDPHPPNLHADAKARAARCAPHTHTFSQAKVQLYHQRLLILKQRLTRMAHFSRPALGGGSRNCIEVCLSTVCVQCQPPTTAH